jgi:hypothetical protein
VEAKIIKLDLPKLRIFCFYGSMRLFTLFSLGHYKLIFCFSSLRFEKIGGEGNLYFIFYIFVNVEIRRPKSDIW